MAQDPQGAVKELESLNPSVKWQETGLFSVADDQVPKVGGSEEIMTAALGLSASKPFSTKLIQSGSALYALKFKSVQEGEPVKEAEEKPGGGGFRGGGGNSGGGYNKFGNDRDRRRF